jgi:hypothetical protein
MQNEFTFVVESGPYVAGKYVGFSIRSTHARELNDALWAWYESLPTRVKDQVKSIAVFPGGDSGYRICVKVTLVGYYERATEAKKEERSWSCSASLMFKYSENLDLGLENVGPEGSLTESLNLQLHKDMKREIDALNTGSILLQNLFVLLPK